MPAAEEQERAPEGKQTREVRNVARLPQAAGEAERPSWGQQAASMRVELREARQQEPRRAQDRGSPDRAEPILKLRG